MEILERLEQVIDEVTSETMRLKQSPQNEQYTGGMSFVLGHFVKLLHELKDDQRGEQVKRVKCVNCGRANPPYAKLRDSGEMLCHECEKCLF